MYKYIHIHSLHTPLTTSSISPHVGTTIYSVFTYRKEKNKNKNKFGNQALLLKKRKTLKNKIKNKFKIKHFPRLVSQCTLYPKKKIKTRSIYIQIDRARVKKNLYLPI